MPFEAEEKGSQGNRLRKGGEQGRVTLSCDPNRGRGRLGLEPDPTSNKKREMELVVSGSSDLLERLSPC